MLECDHCSLQITEAQAVFDEINGQKKVFCCTGCRGVFRFISGEGLSDFYDRRETSWTPGPPEEKPVELSAFSEGMKTVGDQTEIDIVIDGIRCASCIWLIEKILLRTDGVTYARVNYATHRARIRWGKSTDIVTILTRLKSIGYSPRPSTAGAYEEEVKAQQRELLIRFGTAVFFSMQLMLYSVALYAGYFQGIGEKTRLTFQLISLGLATPILFYSGNPFIRGAARGLRNRSFTMDLLIVTGAGSAYFYSIYQIISGGEVYFDTAAMIITLILLGRYIETGAKGRSSEVITKLLSLNPKEAVIIRDQGSGVGGKGQEARGREYVTVPVASIQTGDLVQIKPGERIPFDGSVMEGESEVDESMLTGESKPVSKVPGSDVFCGTQNLYGSLVFSVKRTGENTVLSQIIRTVENAQARRAPVQALADRVVGYFVPAVILLSCGTFIFWISYGRVLTPALMNAVSVLVIACPCALGLATPLAVLIGTTKSASRGILIKGGDIIERARDIDTVVLDKTGTITEGRPHLEFYAGIGIPDDEALWLSSSLEKHSEHSIARAIVNASRSPVSMPVSDFAAHPGKGISGTMNGKHALVGSRAFIESESTVESLESAAGRGLTARTRQWESSGSTVVYLAYDGQPSGIFVISDEIRGDAGRSVLDMQKTGYDVMMITGDVPETALAVAEEAGLGRDKVMARKSPVEKAEAIQIMQKQGKVVLMVGDGMNDAPALVQADVGMAIGRATDIALESADIVLMRSSIGLVPDSLRLSRKICRIIRQNLFWAFAYNIIALPLAVMGLLHPIVAALSMTFSSLSVVGNSMRLRRG
jgi:Cu2+-exporting ATPase